MKKMLAGKNNATAARLDVVYGFDCKQPPPPNAPSGWQKKKPPHASHLIERAPSKTMWPSGTNYHNYHADICHKKKALNDSQNLVPH